MVWCGVNVNANVSVGARVYVGAVGVRKKAAPKHGTDQRPSREKTHTHTHGAPRRLRVPNVPEHGGLNRWGRRVSTQRG